MNFSEMKEIISLINESNLTEFQVKDQQFELYLSKNKQATNHTATTSSVEQAVVNSAPAVNFEASQSTAGNQQETAPTEVSEGHAIKSPLVGVVYLKPSPDKEQFKQVGDAVKKGDVVCIIEAMKVMNEIVSDIDGVITAVHIENEEVVEFGQPLFEVKEG